MQISKRFRNGLVLMIYESITDFGDRDYDLSSDLDLKHWYCMNGIDEMVGKDMINKFARCQSVAGEEEGHNDDYIISHDHTMGNGGVAHTHNLTADGDHYHTGPEIMNALGALGGWLVGSIEYLTSNADFYDTTSDGAHFHTYDSGGSHWHTLETAGVSGTGKNMPYYKTMCFIQRKK